MRRLRLRGRENTVYGRVGAVRIFIKSTTSRAASATSVFTTRWYDRGPHAAGAVGHLLQPVLRGVQRGRRGRGRGAGYALHFISPLHGSLARAMSRATVDGVVAIGLSDDHPEVEQIRRAGVPIVLVDSTALPDHGSIEVDDAGGARAAAEHVIGAGPSRRPDHRRRAAGAVDRTMEPGGVSGRRLRGYREAFAAVGVRIPDERVVVGPASIEGGIAALERPGRTASGRPPSWP